MPHNRRGVYRSCMTTAEGLPYLFARTADNRCLARMVVYPWDDEAAVAALLWAKLNREDPRLQRAA